MSDQIMIYTVSGTDFVSLDEYAKLMEQFERQREVFEKIVNHEFQSEDFSIGYYELKNIADKALRGVGDV